MICVSHRIHSSAGSETLVAASPSDPMDFHSLTRRELQSLCKLNKIPANLTNLNMADALQSLHVVVGIEDFMKLPQSETADLVEKAEASSPKLPQTRCRTSTRQKLKSTETETLSSTVTRTTRRGSKQLPTEVDESNNGLQKTPAVSRTCKKASSRRNVGYQLNECENEPKDEGLVENRYSTRRSTMLTEKKSAAPRVNRGTENAVKIDSFSDQVDVTSKESVEVQENSMETGNTNAEVEDICSAFEKLDVVIVEEEATHKRGEENQDGGEVNNLKQKSDENSNSCEDGDIEDKLKTSQVKNDEVHDVMKPESDGISSPYEEATHRIGEEDEVCDEVNNLKQESDETLNSCEDVVLENDLKIPEVKNGELYGMKPESDGISSPCNLLVKHNSVTVQEEHSDSEDISSPCENDNLEHKLNLGEETFNAISGFNLSADKENSSDCQLDNNASLEKNFTTQKYDVVSAGVDAESAHEDTFSADSEMHNQVPETNEFTTMVSMFTDETKNPNDEINTKETDEMSENTVDKTVDAIPTVDETMTEEVGDLKPELFTDNNVNEKSDADSVLTQNQLISSHATGHPRHVTPVKKATPFKNTFSVVLDDKENIVDQGKIRKKEKDDEMKEIKSFNEMSIRMLKKQLKALTLKNTNSKEDAAATTRPALQALCENQMVLGGGTEN